MNNETFFINIDEWKRAIGFLTGLCIMHVKPHEIEITPFTTHEWQTGISDQNEESCGVTVRFWCSSASECVYRVELSLLRNFFKIAQSDAAIVTLKGNSIEFALTFDEAMRYGVFQIISAERIA